ncbi:MULTISPECIES: DUF1428 domain-containing protein [unclassified Haematobacter]|uniref:DUF1428 domain-containing protein n=1 Tax=unclassified Haematobacter TaxID=2640585 RepID=UPI0025C38FE4|nr:MULTISPECIES: DUF1428 domain-containing protein [unclassified Haematobacter]
MYVDGFVVPVKKSRMEDYRKLADLAGSLWTEHGALSVVEAKGDDIASGPFTSFPQAVLLADDEVVFFSWITFRDRAHRHAVNEKVMSDPRLSSDAEDPPFSMDRMIYGGFEVVVRRP